MTDTKRRLNALRIREAIRSMCPADAFDTASCALLRGDIDREQWLAIVNEPQPVLNAPGGSC